MSPAVIAALISGVTAIGVVILQILSTQRDKIREEKKRREDAEENAKKEFEARVEDQRKSEIKMLREELERLRTQIAAAEQELLSWKNKYWSLREQYVTQLTALNKEMHSRD